MLHDVNHNPTTLKSVRGLKGSLVHVFKLNTIRNQRNTENMIIKNLQSQFGSFLIFNFMNGIKYIERFNTNDFFAEASEPPNQL